MTFLNPAILWALAAVSIPILIHIFNLKRTKKIEFSTLMFLKEIQQSKYRRIKLKQLLILLCRIAFIILLVMMFARPFDTGFLGSPGNKAKSSVLLILDDSFSMLARTSSGNELDAAKRKISETIDILGSDDEIYFTTVSAINSAGKNFLVNDPNRLKDSLTAIKPSDITRNLNEVLYYANDILKSSTNSYKEIYLFTDGQKSFIENSSTINNAAFSTAETRISIVYTGSRTANNLSIDTLNLISKIFEKNRPVKLQASVTNHNNYNVVNKSLVLSSGTVKDEKVIDVPANSTVEVEFIMKPESAGFTGGAIELVQSEIADDEISGDNKQYFTFYVPQKVNVLLASGSPSGSEYLKLALSSSEELFRTENSEGKVYFDINEISGTDVSGYDLNKYDCIILSGKSGFADNETKKLAEYIDNGGGVIVYPGLTSSPESYNNSLMKSLDLPYINSRFTESTPAGFDKIDYSHPVFEGVFKKVSGENSVPESPAVKSGFGLAGGVNSISVVTLTNGKNFLVEYSKGKGKLLMFAVSPDFSDSDFPAKNLFPPVTVRSVLYMANINGIKPGIPGRDYFADISGQNPADSLELSSGPKENKRNIIPYQENIQLMNMQENIKNSSVYSLSSGGNELIRFPVNYEKKESYTARMAPKETKEYLKTIYNIDAEIVEPNETVSASILNIRTGSDLWQYFLIASLIFLLIEYLLARSILKSK
jgi:hypothetical protein